MRSSRKMLPQIYVCPAWYVRVSVSCVYCVCVCLCECYVCLCVCVCKSVMCAVGLWPEADCELVPGMDWQPN